MVGLKGYSSVFNCTYIRQNNNKEDASRVNGDWIIILKDNKSDINMCFFRNFGHDT